MVSSPRLLFVNRGKDFVQMASMLGHLNPVFDLAAAAL